MTNTYRDTVICAVKLRSRTKLPGTEGDAVLDSSMFPVSATVRTRARIECIVRQESCRQSRTVVTGHERI